MSIFKINTKFLPAGDQPKAISELTDGLKRGLTHQTLLGVTGSGKTFTSANVIKNFGKPTLVIAHNKTLAGQLAEEYKDFFPESAVHYFVSYYDFYQPEAYMPITDTYIEKEAMINEEIERLRHASTEALLTRKDVIIVASVSCIYGLGSPEEYLKVNKLLTVGKEISRSDLVRYLIEVHYERTNADIKSGQFRAIGSSVELMPVGEEVLVRFEFNGDKILSIQKINPITRTIIEEVSSFLIFPAKHFISDKSQIDRAVETIKLELNERLKELDEQGKILEAERLKRRVRYDLAMIKEVGYCNGIENYSRHFSGKMPGEPPDTLLSYFPRKKDGSPDFLTIIDESHVTIPQIGAMQAGDASRKKTLVEHGFRLPSAMDNRPLKFHEFEKTVGPMIFTSATPGNYEKEKSQKVVEQVIRPTGLVDPILEIRGVIQKEEYKGQIQDFIIEAEAVIKKGFRAIATTLTKKMAEDLSEYLAEKGIKTKYLHSDIDTLDRLKILSEFRHGADRGGFDCIVGVNLLREGLDLPEVALIGILDADKEGFLRSETSLIQIIGRAARNIEGKVILYADNITNSMKKAIDETERRRKIQLEYNKKHGIVPKTIIKEIKMITDRIESEQKRVAEKLIKLDEEIAGGSTKNLIKEKEKLMADAVKNLDFETASILRDEIIYLKEKRPKRKKVTNKK